MNRVWLVEIDGREEDEDTRVREGGRGNKEWLEGSDKETTGP